MWAGSYTFPLIINIISEICIWTDEDGGGFITPLDILIFYPSIVTDSLWPSLSQWEKDRSLETLFSLYLSPLLFSFQSRKDYLRITFSSSLSLSEWEWSSQYASTKTSKHWVRCLNTMRVPVVLILNTRTNQKAVDISLSLSFISSSFNSLISRLLLLVLLHFGPLGSFHAFVVLVHFLFNRSTKLDRSLSRAHQSLLTTLLFNFNKAFQYDKNDISAWWQSTHHYSGFWRTTDFAENSNHHNGLYQGMHGLLGKWTGPIAS